MLDKIYEAIQGLRQVARYFNSNRGKFINIERAMLSLMTGLKWSERAIEPNPYFPSVNCPNAFQAL